VLKREDAEQSDVDHQRGGEWGVRPGVYRLRNDEIAHEPDGVQYHDQEREIRHDAVDEPADPSQVEPRYRRAGRRSVRYVVRFRPLRIHNDS
jgi:hypothetical protein